MGYEYYPQGLAHVIRRVYSALPLPILVTENGIGTSDDSRRVAFIREALKGVEACACEGIPVLGCCHWSLLDNFEWQKGYSKTSGSFPESPPRKNVPGHFSKKSPISPSIFPML